MKRRDFVGQVGCGFAALSAAPLTRCPAPTSNLVAKITRTKIG